MGVALDDIDMAGKRWYCFVISYLTWLAFSAPYVIHVFTLYKFRM